MSGERTTVYENVDGSVTRVYSAGRSNFRADDGSWRPIDTRLVERGGRLHMAANDLSVSVAGPPRQRPAFGGGVPQGVDSSAVQLGTWTELSSLTLPGGQTVGYDLAGAARVLPEVSGSTAIYRDILAHTDIETVTHSSGLKETIILRSEQAASSWVFPMRLVGLTARLEPDGSVSLLDADGEVAARIPRGFMIDSAPVGPSGDPTSFGDVFYELIELDGGLALRVTVDEAWLRDPARVWPVRVDPTTTVGTSDDVYIDTDSGTGASSQNGTSIAVGQYGEWIGGDFVGQHKARGFIAFAGLGPVAGKRVTSARLKLYLTWTSDCNHHLPLRVHRVRSSWSRSGLSTAGFDGPAVSIDPIGSLTINDHYPACTNNSGNRSTGQWWTVNLEPATFNGWSSGNLNYGLALRADENNPYSWKRFTSENYSSTYQPRLELTYADNVRPQINQRHPAYGDASPTLTPQLMADAHDPDGYPKSLTYKFSVWEQLPAVPPATEGEQEFKVDSGWIDDRLWTVPAGLLEWGKTYRWDVQVFDGQATSSTIADGLRNVLTTTPPQSPITMSLSANGEHGFAPGVGNYTTEATDVSVASVGPALSIRRFYNSGDPRQTGAFGTGWSSLADTRVRERMDAAGGLLAVAMTFPTGQEIAFARRPDGTFVPPMGRYATFTTVTGGYQMVDKDGTTYKFTAATGQAGVYGLASVTDVSGRTLALDWAAGRPVTMTSASGRALQLTWEQPVGAVTAHIVTVTNDVNDTWQYGYSGDQLISVCPPTNPAACVQYSYTVGSHFATTVQNLDPYSYWRLGESEGDSADSEVTARMGVDSGTYTSVALGQPGPLAGSAATAATFDGTSSQVSLPVSPLSRTGQQSIAMWFKTTSSGVIYGQSRDPITSATTNAAYTPILYTGTDGKLYGQFPTMPETGQQWGISHQASGRCLDGVAATNYKQVQLYDCNGSTNKLWTWDSSQRLSITVGGVTKCLDALNGHTADGTEIVMYTCHDGTHQKWTLHPDGRIVNKKANKCLDAVGGTGNGTELVLWTCLRPGTARQSWFPSAHSPMVSTVTVNDDQWHHAALVADADVQKLYVDGVEVATKSAMVSDIAPRYAYLGAGYLGGLWPKPAFTSSNRNLGYRSYFAGSLAEVAQFNRPLTAPEVTALHEARGSTKLLSSVTRPSGGIQAQIDYDPIRDVVSQVTDANGATWVLNEPTVSGSSLIHAAAVLGAAPADYWRMKETAVVAEAVNEVNGSTATYSNVTVGVAGPFDDATAAQFNGTSSAVTADASSIDTSSSFTASAWVRLTDKGSARTALSVDGERRSGFFLGYHPAVDRWGLFMCESETDAGACVRAASAQAPVLNEWTHLVGVYDRPTNTMKLYVNGVLEQSASINPMSQAQGPLVIGRGKWIGAQTNYWAGGIAEAATYRQALTEQQIALQFAARDKAEGDVPAKHVTMTGPSGQPIEHIYDLMTNRKIRSVDAIGGITKYGYNPAGFMSTVTDPNNNLVQYEYDVRGNVTRHVTCQDRSVGACTSTYYSYFPDATTKHPPPDRRNDVMLTMRDGRSADANDNGYLTSYEYDPVTGHLLKTTDPLGRITQTIYTDGTTVAAVDGGFAPAGLPWKVITPGGATQMLDYYANGDIARTTDAEGLVTEYIYDSLGRIVTEKVISSTFPGGLVTSYEYDKLSRVIKQTAPSVTNRVTGAVHTLVTTSQYDDDGRITQFVQSDLTGGDAPRTATITYNVLGQKASQTDSAAGTTTYGYDAYGRVVQETYADGQVVDTLFDPVGNKLNTTIVGWVGDPDSPSAPQDLVPISNAYDPGGRLVVVTDADGWESKYEYTDNNLIARVLRRNPDTGEIFVTEQNTYDAAGNLIRQVTNNGATVQEFTLDAASRMTSVTLDPADIARTTQYAYSPDNHVLSTTVTSSATVVGYAEATYDSMGRMETATAFSKLGVSPTSHVTTYQRDEAGHVIATTDPNGNTTHFEVDEMGRPVVITAPTVTTEVFGSSPVQSVPASSVGYNTFGERTELRDQNGHVTTLSYDANGRVESVTLPDYTPPGSSTPITASATNGYDATGQLVSSTDPLGKQTLYVYDQLGRVTRTTNPDGGVTRWTYDINGNVLSHTDPTGAVSTATYDFLGRQVTSTQVVRQAGSNYTTSFGYDSGGRLASVTSPAGVVTSATYNAAGQPVTVTDGSGAVTSYEYDLAGRLKWTYLADGSKAESGWDDAGRLVSQARYDAGNNLLSSQTRTYDGNGNVVELRPGHGVATTFEYDASNLLTRMEEPLAVDVNSQITDSIVSTFGYDLAGQRTRFTNGRGQSFWTTFNSWGLPESAIEPATAAYPAVADRTFTTVYDIAGRPIEQRSPGGVTVTNTFDDMGRVTGSSGVGAEASTAARSFGYDLAGRIVSLSGSGGTNTLSWDDRGQLRSTTGPLGDSSFTYTPDGLMASRQDAAGTTTYGYDSAGRLASASNPGAGIQASYSYNSMSRVSQIVYGANGNRRTFAYDGMQRIASDELTTPGGTSLGKITYGYDSDSNLIAKTTTGFAGSANNTYTYDLAHRLTTWNDGTPPTLYAYDKAGNRVQAGGRTFTYDERNQLASSPTAGTTYQYTARGTLRSTTTGSVQLDTLSDAFGQVARQYHTVGTFSEYTYDGLGRALKAGFAYTGLGNHLASDGTATYTRGPGGQLLGVADGGAQVLTWTDRHTDVVGQFTATSTALTGSVTYEPLGKVVTSTGMTGSLGYQSEFTDSLTGRVNMHSRWYNPDTGQFDSRDSMSLSPVPGSVNANRFAYGNANPLRYTDPSGHWAFAADGDVGVSPGSTSSKDVVYTPAKYFKFTQTGKMTLTAEEKERRDRQQALRMLREVAAGPRSHIDPYGPRTKPWGGGATEGEEGYYTTCWAGSLELCQIENARQELAALEKHIAEQKSLAKIDFVDLILDVAWQIFKDVTGLSDLEDCFGKGDLIACGSLVIGLFPLGKVLKLGKTLFKAVDRVMSAYKSWQRAVKIGKTLISQATKRLDQVRKKLDDLLAKFNKKPTPGKPGTPNVPDQPPPTPAPKPGKPNKPDKPAGKRDPEPERSKEPDKAECHSFAPSTPVLMADGSAKPISQVNIGDEVVATDPETGQTSAQPVTMLHLNRDVELTDVTVSATPPAAGDTAVGEGEGDRSTRGPTVILETTQNHPFWDASTQEWVDAAELVPGESTLIGPDGQTRYVVAVENFLGSQDMRDLTVATTHTYYVVAGDTPVLVHNCGTGGGFFARMFKSKAQLADEAMRASRKPIRLGDLEGIKTPDYGDPVKIDKITKMDDDLLLEAINNPDELGSSIVIHNGEVVQGNHRIATALARMGKPGHPKITANTLILAAY